MFIRFNYLYGNITNYVFVNVFKCIGIYSIRNTSLWHYTEGTVSILFKIFFTKNQMLALIIVFLSYSYMMEYKFFKCITSTWVILIVITDS